MSRRTARRSSRIGSPTARAVTNSAKSPAVSVIEASTNIVRPRRAEVVPSIAPVISKRPTSQTPITALPVPSSQVSSWRVATLGSAGVASGRCVSTTRAAGRITRSVSR